MSTIIDGGGPAFPTLLIEPKYGSGYKGMTLRDYFAGQAMIGILPKDPIGASTWIGYAAYEIADAMIRARNREANK